MRRLQIAALVLAMLGTAWTLRAADRYALIVTGASGGESYADKYDEWRQSLVNALVGKLGYPVEHVVVLAEQQNEAARVGRATREGVLHALAELSHRVTSSDALLIVLIGHGASDGAEAKFNLVGPDLSATDWANAVRPIAGTLMFVDTASGSFPFMKPLAGPRRIVVTAADASAQQFETIFPEFFIRALTDPAADADKDGRVSMWEAFAYASSGVRRKFEADGRLPTERSLLDDTGRGTGVGAQVPQAGQVARLTFLDREVPATARAAADDLERTRAMLVAQIEELKGLKNQMAPDEYAARLERMLLALARVSAALRNKS